MKKSAAVYTVILVLLLGALLWNAYRIEKHNAEVATEIERAIQPLSVQYSNLHRELEELEETYATQKAGIGVTSIVFTDMDERIYLECYPLMQEKECAGVLVISDSAFPGMQGCMREGQFRELLENGWSICLEWNTQKSLEQWLPLMTDRLAKLGLEPGNIMYFPNGTYSEDYDAVLLKHGFTIAVQHGEVGDSLIISEDEDGVWRPSTVGLQGKGAKSNNNKAISARGYLINEVGFRSEGTLYDETKFVSMLEFCNDNCEANALMITDIDSARQYYAQRGVGDVQMEEAYSRKREELQAQMAAVQEQMEAIRRSFQ